MGTSEWVAAEPSRWRRKRRRVAPHNALLVVGDEYS